MKQEVLADSAERDGLKQCICEMTDFLQGQVSMVGQYSDQMVRQLVEKITVLEDKIIIEFKSGVEIHVEI